MWTKSGHQPQPPPTPPAEKGERLATFDRGQGKELRVNLDHYEGHPFISLRVWEKGWPTKSGTSLRFKELPDLLQVLGQLDEAGGQGADPRDRPEPRRDLRESDDGPQFVEKNRRPQRVDQARRETFPTPGPSEAAFDEFGG